MKKLEILDFGLRILDWVPWRRDFGWKARSFARRGICCKRILDCGLGNRGMPHKLVDGGITWTYSFTNGNASLSLPVSCNEALQRYRLALESAKYRRLP